MTKTDIMEAHIRTLSARELPRQLLEIPQPPEQLYLRGQLPPPQLKLLAVVGSRAYSSYGKRAVRHLIEGLRGQPVGIVSGLALGIDALAHEAALAANLYTLAVFGTGLDESVWYPAKNRPLAYRIVASGGGLLSEYPADTRAAKWTFPQRNRLVVGLSQATLLVEAAEQSGTLITARLTADYNRELGVVPGDIFSKTSRGVHQFLKLGATPITDPADLLELLGLEAQATPNTKPPTLSADATAVVALLSEPLPRDALIRALGRPTAEAATLLTRLELEGTIANDGGTYRSLV